MARSSTPTSTTSRAARSRAIGSGGASRVPIASCDPAGRCSASSATASRQSWLETCSTWSRTSATGSAMADIAPTRRVTAVAAIEAPPSQRVRRSSPGSIPSPGSTPPRRRPAGSRDRCPAHPAKPTLFVPAGRPTGSAASSCRSPPEPRPRRPAADGKRAADRPARPGTRSRADPGTAELGLQDLRVRLGCHRHMPLPDPGNRLRIDLSRDGQTLSGARAASIRAALRRLHPKRMMRGQRSPTKVGGMPAGPGDRR